MESLQSASPALCASAAFFLAIWALTLHITAIFVGLSLCTIILALYGSLCWFSTTAEEKPRLLSWLKGAELPLLFVTVFGGAIVAYFGFARDQLVEFWKADTPWESWERGALVWNGCFLLYQLFTVVAGIVATAENHEKRNKVGLVQTVLLIIFFTASGLVCFALYGANQHGARQPIAHIQWAALLALLLLILDYTLGRGHPYPPRRRAFELTVLLADLPTFLAFITLLIFLATAHPAVKEAEIFASGAITFQLLSSKVVFVVIEAGAFAEPEAIGPDERQGAAAMGAHV
jgi:hypothetical protein